MNRFNTFGLVGLSAVAVVATLDSALGLGGGALLADICRTFLEDDMSGDGMGGMAMEVKPVPLIALSLGATAAAIAVLTRDHNLTIAGRSQPDGQEQSAILSAILVIATVQGRVSRQEVMDVFRIVTGYPLEDELADFAMERFNAFAETDPENLRLARVSTAIGRRRVLAAALMMGCVARQPTNESSRLIEQMTVDIGAKSDDVAEAQKALTVWQGESERIEGVSMITMLRHRVLTLRPA